MVTLIKANCPSFSYPIHPPHPEKILLFLNPEKVRNSIF